MPDVWHSLRSLHRLLTNGFTMKRRWSLGPYTAIVLHTPGHTPGSACFYIESQNLVFSGDTLFRGGIGRTDLWGGDGGAIIQSIQERLYSLKDETQVIPGHGGESSIGWEREHNMYVHAT